jgi:4-diphosphocytidyl-2-C-methyl-D-erythritol kinase
MRIRTHAKVNLFLRVLGRRPDGYHEVETILHGISLADDIELQTTPGEGVEVDMRLGAGLRGALPELRDNLVWRAAQRVLERAGARRGAAIRVTKHIPLGAGLGGGSGNAAGVLVALSELWGGVLSAEEIAAVAPALGSDVPYCLGGGTVLATSRGEALTPLASTRDLWFVCGILHEPLSTAAVYAAWEPAAPASPASAPLVLALGAGEVTEVASLLHNDLEPAATKLRPRVARGKEALLAAGALGAAMSGSGPTVFGIARDRRHARSVADRVEPSFDLVVVASSHGACIERVG